MADPKNKEKKKKETKEEKKQRKAQEKAALAEEKAKRKAEKKDATSADKKKRKSKRKIDPDKEGTAAFLSADEMNKLNRLVLMSRYVVEGNLAGAHRSPLKGQSSEFADHKAYGVGDDPKHIDWKVLGRTDKYYVKRYEDETNLRVYIVLDRSNSMRYGSDDVTKYEHACHLAAAMGYVVVKARDSIGMFVHSDKIDMRMDARNSFNHLNSSGPGLLLYRIKNELLVQHLSRIINAWIVENAGIEKFQMLHMVNTKKKISYCRTCDGLTLKRVRDIDTRSRDKVTSSKYCDVCRPQASREVSGGSRPQALLLNVKVDNS